MIVWNIRSFLLLILSSLIACCLCVVAHAKCLMHCKPHRLDSCFHLRQFPDGIEQIAIQIVIKYNIHSHILMYKLWTVDKLLLFALFPVLSCVEHSILLLLKLNEPWDILPNGIYSLESHIKSCNVINELIIYALYTFWHNFELTFIPLIDHWSMIWTRSISKILDWIYDVAVYKIGNIKLRIKKKNIESHSKCRFANVSFFDCLHVTHIKSNLILFLSNNMHNNSSRFRRNFFLSTSRLWRYYIFFSWYCTIFTHSHTWDCFVNYQRNEKFFEYIDIFFYWRSSWVGKILLRHWFKWSVCWLIITHVAFSIFFLLLYTFK